MSLTTIVHEISEDSKLFITVLLQLTSHFYCSNIPLPNHPTILSHSHSHSSRLTTTKNYPSLPTTTDHYLSLHLTINHHSLFPTTVRHYQALSTTICPYLTLPCTIQSFSALMYNCPPLTTSYQMAPCKYSLLRITTNH